MADGHIIAQSDWCTLDGHYVVLVNGNWHMVPASALRDSLGGPNPTGHAIVWLKQVGSETVILCFAPGSEL